MNEKWLNSTCKIPLIVSLNESDANSVEQNVVLLAEKNSVGDGGAVLNLPKDDEANGALTPNKFSSLC